MLISKYDIFSGKFGDEVMWIEMVEGLGPATARMKDLAAGAPGRYFVFCTTTHRVLASMDNSEPNRDHEVKAG